MNPILMGLAPIDQIEVLVARGDTLASLERLLKLSPGYLSKVRRRRATASPQLAALLEVLVHHPEVKATLGAARAPRAKPARQKPASDPRAFIRKLEPQWKRDAVRFHAVDDLLLEALDVPLPPGPEPSLRYLIHPHDRHALAVARALGATVATAGTRASVCTLPGDRHIVFVFPLDPLHHLFDAPSLADFALYFALQGDDDAEARLLAIVTRHAMTKKLLQQSFRDRYGGTPALPPTEWLLRATFDLELARKRIAALPTPSRRR